MTDLSINPALALRPVAAHDATALAEFFRVIVANGDARFFSPHPLTGDGAAHVAAYRGRDVYTIAEEGGAILAYGLLRGWDEGFVVPSLGITTHPSVRGTGIGRLLMNYLHTVARRRGAPRVRLRVHRDNMNAVQLYRSMGYGFGDDTSEYLVGYLELTTGGQGAG